MKMIYLPLAAVVIITLFVIGSFVSNNRWEEQQDRVAFNSLRGVACEMIDNRAAGVTFDGEIPFIASFDSFFAYVQEKHPNWTQGHSEKNPFPLILQSRKGYLIPREIHGPSDTLLRGVERYTDNSGESRQFLLHANGSREAALEMPASSE